MLAYANSLKTNNLESGSASEAQGQLILLEAEVSSDLNDFVRQAVEIAQRNPQIEADVERDLDRHGLAKKELREADRRYFEQLNPSFESMAQALAADDTETTPRELELEGGRPRMPAIVVLVLLLVRGWLGGPKSSRFQLMLKESITLHQFFNAHAFQVPGASTVCDNVNAVSEETLDAILRCQLGYAREAGLDTFEDIVIDSTAISAHSKYPTDSGLMAALAIRMTGLITGLKKLKLGFPDWARRKGAQRSEVIATEIELFAKQIGMMSGKKNIKTQRNALYAKIYTRAGRLVRTFAPLLSAISKKAGEASLQPSKSLAVQQIIRQGGEDLGSIAQISAYSRRRVFRDQAAPASEKILSISDTDAAIIKKGGWDTVLGYRPQLAFSGRGLLTAHRLPRGNAADSGQLPEILEASESNTGVVPKRVSLDDGYTSGKVRDDYMAEHGDRIEVFSFAGSKGLNAIGKETYESASYKKARAERSAAESRIYTLKFNHGYDEVMRRGIDAVRHEQLTKVLAYNIRRLVWLTKEREKEKESARLGKRDGHLLKAA